MLLAFYMIIVMLYCMKVAIHISCAVSLFKLLCIAIVTCHWFSKGEFEKVVEVCQQMNGNVSPAEEFISRLYKADALLCAERPNDVSIR